MKKKVCYILLAIVLAAAAVVAAVVLTKRSAPAQDTVALKYIYDHRPDINAIIHTHQPYATAVGLVTDEMPACCTTLCNVCLGSVPVAPYSAAASEEMGISTV